MNSLRPDSRQVYGLFNDSYPPVLDGVTLTVENYVRWLSESGRRVCVVTPWNRHLPPADGYELHSYFSLPIFNRHPYRYGYPNLDRRIWRKLRDTPFRIVHAHCPFSSGRLAAYAARQHHVPLVATFHSKYRTDLEHSLPEILVKYEMKKIMRFYEQATEVWIPQGAVEETLREYGYRGRVRIVDNGNDFAEDIDDIPAYKRAARKALGVPPGRLVLLFVGQHILEKGLEVIVRALAMLDPGIDFEMHFIGEGYARGQMIAFTGELGLLDKVKFHGLISGREELRRHYAAADLFLFPSFYDNAPLVVREAAAVCTPSLLLEGSTAAENVADGKNGFLTRRSAEAYAAAITSLAARRDVIVKAGLGASHTLCRPWRDVMDEVINLYDEIVNRYGTGLR